jgi:uncharacterized membrane protein
MQSCKRKAAIIILGLAMAIFAVSNFAVAEANFGVVSTNLLVYRDGLTHVKQLLNTDELASTVTVEMLATSVENVLVLDKNQMPIDYTIKDSNITIISLGEKQVSLEYDTLTLTEKQAETWTLVTNSPYELTVYLPANATLFYLNEMPSAINTVDSGIRLTLPVGSWKISYSLPLIAQVTDQNSETSNEVTGANTPFNPLIIISIIAIAAVSVTAFMFVKRSKKPSVKKVLKTNPQLQPDDQKIVQFLIEKGGTAFEAEIREKFPDMPRTSLWRLVRRLERLDIVEVNKIGLENQVKLK